MWDAATGRELLVLAGHDVAVHAAAFGDDGKRVLTAGGLRVRVTEARFADSIVAGEDARREAFVHIAKQGGGVRVMAVVTEPAE